MRRTSPSVVGIKISSSAQHARWEGGRGQGAAETVGPAHCCVVCVLQACIQLTSQVEVRVGATSLGDEGVVCDAVQSACVLVRPWELRGVGVVCFRVPQEAWVPA